MAFSLRVRLFIVLFFVLSGAAAVIWFGIRPSYADAILEERLTLITEYQQQRIRESDLLLYLWLKSSVELQEQVLNQPLQVETTFNNYARLFPDLLGFRLVEIQSGEFLDVVTDRITAIPDYRELSDFSFEISLDRDIWGGWSRDRLHFFFFQEFDHQGSRFRITTLFDASRITESMMQNVLREDAFTTIWLPSGATMGRDLPSNERPSLSGITSFKSTEYGGRPYLAVSSNFTSLPLVHSIYIDLSILQQQVSQLFSQSLIMLIIAFIALGAAGHLLISRVQRPINNFLEDVAPFANYDFDKSFRVADLPELSGVTLRMEEIREKLAHYKRINVENVIVQEQRNRLLMTYATGMVAQYDVNGHFTFINDQFGDLLQEMGLFIVTAELSDFMHHPKLQINKELEADILHKDGLTIKTRKIDLEVRINEEHIYYFELHLNEITDQDQNHLGGLLLLNDITRSREIDKMRTEMINIIVHELQNPVSAGLGLTSYLIEEEVTEEEKSDILKMIQGSLNKLSGMIERFLSVSRLESASMKIDKIPVDMNSMVRPVAESFRTQVLDRNIRILINEETTPHVMGSHDLLEDMMRNLISNAIKYGDDNRTIDVALWSNGETVNFSVTDHGYGIPEEFHEKIFQKFYRIKAYDLKKGTGLGLPYVREIVRKHGGTIRVESNPEIGTRFTVSIPISEMSMEFV
jgi:signal transduction histidine kinase